ncbi:MAG: hypothetical protein CMH30_00040 [Micavibrio sp.]|nr:hypothetical protein [Micavibrio sp.]
MKANEFKQILKPLIKQTIKEVLLEEGVLSSVVSEVVKGMGQQTIAESKTRPRRDKAEKEEQYEKQRQERIRRLNETTKMNVDVFKGTEPITESAAQSPMSGVSNTDEGVDISGILNIVNGKWKQLI